MVRKIFRASARSTCTEVSLYELKYFVNTLLKYFVNFAEKYFSQLTVQAFWQFLVLCRLSETHSIVPNDKQSLMTPQRILRLLRPSVRLSRAAFLDGLRNGQSRSICRVPCVRASGEAGKVWRLRYVDMAI